LHIADVHLDTPFKSKDPYFRKFLRESIRQAFEASIDLALSEKVHAVLIAGDLFDQHTLSFTTEKFLIKQAERLKDHGIKLFYATGNHDPYNSVYKNRQIAWPQNVYIFGTSNPEVYTIKDEDDRAIAAVWGVGHENERENRNLISRFPKMEGSIPYIGLAHTMVHGAAGYGEHEVYAPCTIEDIREKGYAYWALGHIHGQNIVVSEPLAVYPGNLVGRNFSEEGVKGVYLVEIDGGGKAKAEFRAVAPVRWITFYVDEIMDCMDVKSLEDKIQKSVMSQLEKYNYSGRFIPRIILKGPCPLFEELQKEEEIAVLADDIKERLSFQFLELSGHQVVRSVEPDKYRNGPHVLGTALSIFDRIQKDDEFLLSIVGNDKIAGLAGLSSSKDKVKYLQSLLYGLDYEITDRITGGSKK